VPSTPRLYRFPPMIDIFALSLAHGLLVLAALRLMARDDLDMEGEPRRGLGTRRKPGLKPLDAPPEDEAAHP